MKNNRSMVVIPFLTILVLMVSAYVLSVVLDCEGISFAKWLASPILVLGSSSGGTTIAIVIFLLVIGGVSNILEASGLIEYMLVRIGNIGKKNRYLYLWIMVFFLMALGSLAGSFEEIIPLVPMCVVLANEFGFDKYLGMGMSVLAVGCGFAAGLANPFTIGIAQRLAEVPLFSGILFRLLGFILIYLLLMWFLLRQAKKVQHDIMESTMSLEKDINKDRAMKAFGIIIGSCLALTIASPLITFLQDYTLIIICFGFLLSGIVCSILLKMDYKDFFLFLALGMKELIPSIILVLMASSIKYTMEESGCLNSIVEIACKMASSMNKVELILFIYALCLILEVFVPSGSAKAFLIIPILVPLVKQFGVSAQLCVLAFAYGDGFSNVFYPTNPGLLISLNLAKINYKDWFKYSWKFQVLNLILTSGILILGLYVGY